MKKVNFIAAIVLALFTPLLFSHRAGALNNTQFTLHSDPTTAVVDLSRITTPPLPGQPLTVNETLLNQNNQPVGSAQINCIVLAFTLSDLLLDCQANFNLTNGTIQGHAIFWTFQHNYTAIVTGGTGAYQGAVGTAQVEDRAPGDETYHFNLFGLNVPNVL